MRSHLALALLFILLNSLASPLAFSKELQQPFKFLTLNFNSEEAPNVTGQLMGELRFHALVHWIQANDPDAVVLQEGWDYKGDPSVALTIAQAVGYDVAYHVGMGIPGSFLDSNAILTKKYLHMSGESDLKLPHSGLYLGDGKTWVIPFGRVSWAIGVKVTLANGDPLYIYTTHLIAEDTGDRADGLRAVDADARSRTASDGVKWDDANIIVAGDFNSEPDEPGPVFMNQVGYIDAFATTHPGDESCTNCGDPRLPWFVPISIGYGLVPSQTTDNTSDHVDYVYSHGPQFKPIASTLVFSAPYQGVWMSDHYGILAKFGSERTPRPENPVHDFTGTAQDSQILTITNDQFLCPDPWNNNGSDDDGNCTLDLPALVVTGFRGVTIENRSDFYFEIALDGPGNIFTAANAALEPGEETSFSFDTKGSYTYTIRNLIKSPNPYRAALQGVVNVQATGY